MSGVVDPDTTARATKSGADVDVHWVVAQGDVVAHGHVHADLDHNTFTQTDQPGPGPGRPGPPRCPASRSRSRWSRAPLSSKRSSGTRRFSSRSPERSTDALPERHRSPTAAAHAAQQLTAPGGLADREVVHMAVKYRRWDADDRVSAQWYAVLSAAKADGVSFLVTDGHRTMAEQQERWNTFQHVGATAAFPSPTAPHIRTGRPDHAIDVNARDGGAMRLAAWLRKHGAAASFPVLHEPWHIEVPRDDLERLAKKVADPLAGYPAKERHWIRAYDALVRMKDAGTTPRTGASGAPPCAGS